MSDTIVVVLFLVTIGYVLGRSLALTLEQPGRLTPADRLGQWLGIADVFDLIARAWEIVAAPIRRFLP